MPGVTVDSVTFSQLTKTTGTAILYSRLFVSNCFLFESLRRYFSVSYLYGKLSFEWTLNIFVD